MAHDCRPAGCSKAVRLAMRAVPSTCPAMCAWLSAAGIDGWPFEDIGAPGSHRPEESSVLQRSSRGLVSTQCASCRLETDNSSDDGLLPTSVQAKSSCSGMVKLPQQPCKFCELQVFNGDFCSEYCEAHLIADAYCKFFLEACKERRTCRSHQHPSKMRQQASKRARTVQFSQ